MSIGMWYCMWFIQYVLDIEKMIGIRLPSTIPEPSNIRWIEKFDFWSSNIEPSNYSGIFDNRTSSTDRTYERSEKVRYSRRLDGSIDRKGWIFDVRFDVRTSNIESPNIFESLQNYFYWSLQLPLTLLVVDVEPFKIFRKYRHGTK